MFFARIMTKAWRKQEGIGEMALKNTHLLMVLGNEKVYVSISRAHELIIYNKYATDANDGFDLRPKIGRSLI